MESGAVDGRILLLFSSRDDAEPRFHVVNRNAPQPFFGIDVEGLVPGSPAIFDDSVLGYPVESLRELPPGEYNVQAVLNRYTTFHREDGHVVKLHMDQWDDTFYLEEATLLLEKFLETTENPHYGGKFVWGAREPHCFTGAPKRESFVAHYLPEMAEHMKRTAPPGARLPDSLH
jgi:hypothetical protein